MRTRTATPPMTAPAMRPIDGPDFDLDEAAAEDVDDDDAVDCEASEFDLVLLLVLVAKLDVRLFEASVGALLVALDVAEVA